MQRLCVFGCQITRTRIHTLLKRLASAHHDNRRKTVLLPECTFQTKQSVKTKEADDVFSRCPLYFGRDGSNVIGCRRPTGGVFIYMYTSDTGHADGVPHSDPWGTQFEVPMKGNCAFLD